MKKELSEYKAKLQEAESKLKHMEGRIESLKNRIKELEESNKVAYFQTKAIHFLFLIELSHCLNICGILRYRN